MMSERELEDVDEWRFQSRISTRAEALRRLCKLGLALDKVLPDLERNIGLASMAVRDLASPLTEKSPRSEEEIKFYKTMIELTKSIGQISARAKMIKSNDFSDERLAQFAEEEEKIFKALDEIVGGKLA